MQNSFFISSKTRKQIIFTVVFFHFIIIALSISEFSWEKKRTIKKVNVQEIVLRPEEKKEPLQKPLPVANRAAKPLLAKEQTTAFQATLQKENQRSALIAELRKNLTKLEESRKEKAKTASSDLAIPVEKIGALAIDNTVRGSAATDSYLAELIRELKMYLFLPEKREVKVELTIQPEGKISQIKIIESASKRNEAYLKKSLPELSFPWFNTYTKVPKQVVVLFTYEN